MILIYLCWWWNKLSKHNHVTLNYHLCSLFQAETDAGRDWMLSEPCVNVTIGRVTELLTSMNMWTASNAALVLARYV